MKGMGQVAAGSTGLIQQGNKYFDFGNGESAETNETYSLGACQQLVPDRGESAVSAIAD